MRSLRGSRVTILLFLLPQAAVTALVLLTQHSVVVDKVEVVDEVDTKKSLPFLLFGVNWASQQHRT